jgi:hypothetical protein
MHSLRQDLLTLMGLRQARISGRRQNRCCPTDAPVPVHTIRIEPAAVGTVTGSVAPNNQPMVRLVVIALLNLLVSACSRTEFAYRNADWLLEYYVRRTVDASAPQREDWRPVLASTLQRHREEELPLVIAYLDLAGRIVRQADSSIGAACLLDGALLLSQRHARLAVDLSVPLLTTLDAAQVRHLAEYRAQRQQDAVEQYLDPDPERREASREKRFIDRIETWTGKLNENQRQQISEALKRIPDLSAPWLAYRAQQTDRLLGMLEAGTSARALRRYLNDWWVQQDGRSAEYRQLWRIAKYEFVLLLDELGTTLTHKQRARFEDRLGALRKDLASFLSPAQPPVSLPFGPVCASAPV